MRTLADYDREISTPTNKPSTEAKACKKDSDQTGAGDPAGPAPSESNGQEIAGTFVELARAEKGKPLKTIDNFLRIMRHDGFYADVKYNLLTNFPERTSKGRTRNWSDADNAASMAYIEGTYGLYCPDKHDMAFTLLASEREYHPIRDQVDALQWDGKERILGFLAKWMKASDTDYTREVSRLIFAGGIHRLYHPGCKFDLMPVLIGTQQGEGKSTIVRWLAMTDEFYGEVTEFEGQKSIEQLYRLWIAEVGELLALTKTREQEAIKSFITTQIDRYRKPWGRYTSDNPRQCIFIGTTNNPRFLSDKTGNRRFLPVFVHSNARELFDHEHDVREYILQCWAEARAGLDTKKMEPVENRALIDTIKAQQAQAMEDDWRVGKIQAYLDEQLQNAFVCIRELREKALYPEKPSPPDDKRESREIGIILDKMEGWEKSEAKHRPTKAGNMGPQWCWRKL